MAEAGDNPGGSGMCLRRLQRVGLGGGGQLIERLPQENDVLASARRWRQCRPFAPHGVHWTYYVKWTYAIFLSNLVRVCVCPIDAVCPCGVESFTMSSNHAFKSLREQAGYSQS